MDCNDDCDECQMANQDDLHAQISDIAPPHVRLRMKVFSLTYYSYIILNYNDNNKNNNINNNSNNNNNNNNNNNSWVSEVFLLGFCSVSVGFL